MRYRSRYDKRDSNEKEIVEQLLEIPGIDVQEGHDDILLGYKGLTYWFEIKDPSRMNKQGQMRHKNRKTEAKQLALAESWKGHYQIVCTIDEILDAIGINR